jgi:hypothetical protein
VNLALTTFLMTLAIPPPTVVIDGVPYELDPSTDLAAPIDSVDPGFPFQASIRCCDRVWSVRWLSVEHAPPSCHEILVPDGIELIDPRAFSDCDSVMVVSHRILRIFEWK